MTDSEKLDTILSRLDSLEPWWMHRRAFSRTDALRYLAEVYCISQKRFLEADRKGQIARMPWLLERGEPAYPRAALDTWAEHQHRLVESGKPE